MPGININNFINVFSDIQFDTTNRKLVVIQDKELSSVLNNAQIGKTRLAGRFDTQMYTSNVNDSALGSLLKNNAKNIHDNAKNFSNELLSGDDKKINNVLNQIKAIIQNYPKSALCILSCMSFDAAVKVLTNILVTLSAKNAAAIISHVNPTIAAIALKIREEKGNFSLHEEIISRAAHDSYLAEIINKANNSNIEQLQQELNQENESVILDKRPSNSIYLKQKVKSAKDSILLNSSSSSSAPVKQEVKPAKDTVNPKTSSSNGVPFQRKIDLDNDFVIVDMPVSQGQRKLSDSEVANGLIMMTVGVKNAQALLDEKFGIADSLASFTRNRGNMDVSDRELTDALGDWIMGEAATWLREGKTPDQVRKKIEENLPVILRNVLFFNRTTSMKNHVDEFIAKNHHLLDRVDRRFKKAERDIIDYIKNYVSGSINGEDALQDKVCIDNFNERSFLQEAVNHCVDLLAQVNKIQAPELKIDFYSTLEDANDVNDTRLFTQHTNTCFMMSIANGLVMSHEGQKVLESFMQKGKDIVKKPGYSKFESIMESRINDSRRAKNKDTFSLGEQWFTDEAGEMLGLERDEGMDIDVTGGISDLRVWNSVGQALHDHKVVVLFVGSRDGEGSGHYRTVTGTWIDKNGKVGFMVRDSLSSSAGQYPVDLTPEALGGRHVQLSFFSIPKPGNTAPKDNGGVQVPNAVISNQDKDVDDDDNYTLLG